MENKLGGQQKTIGFFPKLEKIELTYYSMILLIKKSTATG